MNLLIALSDNPIHGLATQLSVKACDIVRSCVGGALTAIKEVVEVASEVRARLLGRLFSSRQTPYHSKGRGLAQYCSGPGRVCNWLNFGYF